jgi:hypothetical protein
MKLLINNIEVDSIIDQEITITKSVNDMLNLGSREGAFTSEIEANLSTNNKTITNNAQSSNSNSNFPYQNNTATIEIKGETILNGFAELTEVQNTFKFRCFSELSDVVDLIGEGDLNELNLDYANGDPINHIWNYATVVANRNNVWTKGFIYPNINYGKWTLNQNHAHWNDLYPSLFCKYLFLRIFHSIGYAVTGEFLTNELFESSILPTVQIPETPQYFLDANKSRAIATNNVRYYNQDLNPIFFQSYPINNNLQFQNDRNNITKLSPSLYGPMVMSLSFNLSLSASNTASLNLITEDSGTLKINTYALTSGANSFTFNLLKQTASTKYYITISQTQSLGYIDIANLVWENVFSPQKLIENNTVFVAECLPQVSKKDFLLTIVNQFNLMLKVDSLNRTIDFSYFNTVEANKASAIDLSDKMDLTHLPTIQYKLDGYAQNNELNYETDENDEELRKVNNYGQGILFCNNLSIDKTKEIFRSKFAPITRKLALKSPHSVEMAFIHMWALSETTFRTQNVKPRIGYVYNNGEILDLYSTAGEGGGGHGAGHHDSSPSKGVYFENMQFSSGLIPNYYQILFNMLQDVYFLKGNFKIRLKEFMEIDFLKPIFLSLSVKGFGLIEGYFYCNKINQFKINRNESTEIELIKI